LNVIIAYNDIKLLRVLTSVTLLCIQTLYCLITTRSNRI